MIFEQFFTKNIIVQVYQRLEKGNNCEYWEDITIIVKDELHKLRKLDSRTGRDITRDRTRDITRDRTRDRTRAEQVGKELGIELGQSR